MPQISSSAQYHTAGLPAGGIYQDILSLLQGWQEY